MNATIVSNSKRQILEIDSKLTYLYIPLLEEEAKLLGYSSLEGNPALRVSIETTAKI